MLSIARALLLNPKLLILDEPSQGLAPLIVKEVFRIVEQMRREGISVLLVEQNARMSLAVADRAYVLDDGQIVYCGPGRRARRRRGARAGACRRQRRGMGAELNDPARLLDRPRPIGRLRPLGRQRRILATQGSIRPGSIKSHRRPSVDDPR